MMDKETELAVLMSIQEELKKVQLENIKTPGGPRPWRGAWDLPVRAGGRP